MPNLYDALIGTADKQVILRVNSKPIDDGARDITVVPDRRRIAALLQGLGAEERRRSQQEDRMAKSVTSTSPTWARQGLNEFTKQYFPQIKKKGLIVDVRGNGGGFVSPLVIERLRRALVMIEIARNGTPQTNPPQTFVGPMVALM